MVSKSQRKLKDCPKKRVNLKSLGICDFSPEIVLNPEDDGLSSQLLAFGFREPLNCHFLSRFIRTEHFDAVVDVGSNIGYFPIVELASGASQVVAVEPVPESFRLLKENLKGYSNVRLLNSAVSDKNGSVTLFVPNQKNLASVTPDYDYLRGVGASVVDEVVVQACTLQSVIDRFGLGGSRVLVRMDVEGYEKIIGYNIPEAVKGISVELHSPILGYEESMRLFNHWIECGFACVFLSRELDGLNPLISKVGLVPALRLYELFIKRTYSNPSLSVVERFVRLQRENPHLFLVRK